MKLLVSSVNRKAGKTSFIYSLSKFSRFKYEKRGSVRGAERLIPKEGEVTVVEGRENYKKGIANNESDIDEKMDKVILIAKYEDSIFDEIALASRNFKDRLVGVIVSCVKNDVSLEDVPFKVMGLVPYDVNLGGINPKNLAKCVDGYLLADSDILVDDILVGAMSPKCALYWLKKKRQAALVTGGDRVDLQKLALEIGLPCLVLTGGIEPPKVILKKARECGTAVVLSDYDTLTSVEMIQQGAIEPLSAEKAEKAAELYTRHIDFKKLIEILGFQ